MFDDLDATLRVLLASDGAPAEVRAADVSFETPTRDFAPKGPTLNLFLHDVRENVALGDHPPSAASRTAPIWVDCGYLVTAWSPRGGEERPAEEHRLLAMALVWLNRTPLLDSERAVGSLHRWPYPMPVEVARTADGERLGQFWTALGISPRPAFSLVVTVAMELKEPTVLPPQVTALRVQQTRFDEPALAGRVLDKATMMPLAGTVTVEHMGMSTTTGDAGKFAFRELGFGDYTLVVEVAGRPDQRVQVSYAPGSQIHNVLVTAG